MKKFMTILAMVVIAASFSTVSKAQSSYQPQYGGQQPKPTVKAIDSISIVGVPFNALVLTITSITDSVATVSSRLQYVGRSTTGGRGVLNFSDTLGITPSVGISTNAAAIRIAAKHGVTLK
jgi:hypothetical protein